MFGQMQKNFACNTNSGEHVLYGSAIAPFAMNQLNGMASTLELVTDQVELSPWWRQEMGGCRGPAIGLPALNTVDFNFLADVNCADPWGGGATGGIQYDAPFNGPNRARIRTVCAIPGSTSIDASTEYYFFKVRISNAKTVGDGACAGCTDGACIVLRKLQLTQPAGVGDVNFLEQPISRLYVKWQSGSVLGGCPAATPVRTSTWGSLKSLYR